MTRYFIVILIVLQLISSSLYVTKKNLEKEHHYCDIHSSIIHEHYHAHNDSTHQHKHAHSQITMDFLRIQKISIYLIF